MNDVFGDDIDDGDDVVEDVDRVDFHCVNSDIADEAD